MASTLTPDDLQRWVQRTSLASSQKAQHSRVGLAGNLFETSLQLIISLLELAKERNLIPSHIIRNCQNEVERYHLWGDGFGVADGDLDALLAKSSELRFNVISLLHRIGSVVSQGFCKAMKTNIDNEKIRFEQKELNSHLGSAGAMLAGQSSSEADPENEQFSDSEISEEDFSELLEDVALYTDCLMDLTPALENPAPDILINEKEAIPFESFKASSELAFSFCRRIRDQFPMLDVKLVERLAEANSRRSQRIQARVRDAPKSSNLRKDTVSAASSEPAFSETGPDYSVTTKSSFIPGSLFDEEPPTQKQATDWDDNASQTTFASFSTSFYVEDQFGRPKVPPLPEGAAKGRPFECIACSREIRNVRNRQAWKRHIFNDLQPYACTFMECDQPLILFSSRKRFIEHEKSHEHAETPWTCPFCADENEKLHQQAYFKHVARHLREISLAVLPRAADSEAESSSLASKEDSEAHSSQGMSQGDNSPVAGVVSDEKPLPSPEPTAKIDTPESHPPVPAAPEHVGEVSQRQLLSEVKPKEPEIQPCNYKTGKTLGAGDTSVIKECINIKTGRYFATKVMNKKSIHDRKDHIRANIAILKMISTTQRKILGFVDYFETLNNLYLVFDLVIGGTLWDRYYQKGDYTEQEGVDVVQQLLQALKYLHDQGIAHNQVKAESVLYKTPQGNEVVLASLGYLQHEGKPIPMKDDSSSDLTPEEVDLPLNGGLSLKSKDMWGLGVLTYFVFCGYSPFDRDSAQEETHAIMGGDVDFTHKEHWKNVSTHAMDFIKACLTVNVEKRLNADTALQHSWLILTNPPGRELTHHRKTNARKASSSESDERAVIVGDEGVIHRKRGQEIFVRFDDKSYNKTRRSSIADHAPHLSSRPADVKGLPSLRSPEPHLRKGKTTMPKNLVSKHAISELGYMYDEEGENIIIREALDKELIEEVVKLSERYIKTGNENLDQRDSPRPRYNLDHFSYRTNDRRIKSQRIENWRTQELRSVSQDEPIIEEPRIEEPRIGELEG